MGNGMNKILPGLYIGNFKDARDAEQLSKNKVTHILSVHDSARPMLEGVKYLCIPAADSPSQNLCSSRRPEGDPQRTGKSMGCRTRHFKESIKFIHECRLRGEGCLVHCLAGVSRSVTLVIAYIMTVTDFGWEDALHTVRAGRSCANPNLGFQRQLQDFEKHEVHQYRQWLKEEYGESPLRDAEEARNILGLVLPPFPLCKTPRGRHLKLTSKKLLSQKQPVRVSRQRGELKGRPSSCKRRPSQNPGWSQQGQQEARLPPEGGSRGRGRMGALTSPQC
ncbi:dual specificity protein phosphatase 22 isoform X3 [Equus quagga]|uniref:dual specificity protein phosphatase 22 isoform X3 n=1 Tax=Equus quagga TaxID=89248 RepID=UPI001EE1EE72|nr:dual specificity protein phosphatase 22 isoform X3 [Equus quagga]